MCSHVCLSGMPISLIRYLVTKSFLIVIIGWKQCSEAADWWVVAVLVVHTLFFFGHNQTNEHIKVKWMVFYFCVNRSQTRSIPFHLLLLSSLTFLLLKILYGERDVARVFCLICAVAPSSQETIETWLKVLTKVRIMHALVRLWMCGACVCVINANRNHAINIEQRTAKNSFEVKMRWLRMCVSAPLKIEKCFLSIRFGTVTYPVSSTNSAGEIVYA